jgi:hypothetical protein
LNFVYFTDRDLGKRFPEILKSAGLTVERHADHFTHDTADEVWLEAVGKRGWIALTYDRRIHLKYCLAATGYRLIAFSFWLANIASANIRH